MLVILDDLQWTDQTSLLLLHYLARGGDREPLLLLSAYHDAKIDEKLSMYLETFPIHVCHFGFLLLTS